MDGSTPLLAIVGDPSAQVWSPMWTPRPIAARVAAAGVPPHTASGRPPTPAVATRGVEGSRGRGVGVPHEATVAPPLDRFAPRARLPCARFSGDLDPARRAPDGVSPDGGAARGGEHERGRRHRRVVLGPVPADAWTRGRAGAAADRAQPYPFDVRAGVHDRRPGLVSRAAAVAPFGPPPHTPPPRVAGGPPRGAAACDTAVVTDRARPPAPGRAGHPARAGAPVPTPTARMPFHPASSGP